MNALELADALKNMESGWFDDLTLKEAATMLRQQQVELTEAGHMIGVLREHNQRMIEDRSKYEALAHTGGFEAGVESVTKAKYTDAWWKEVAEFNKLKKASEK
jgi:hypothetical protein